MKNKAFYLVYILDDDSVSVDFLIKSLLSFTNLKVCGFSNSPAVAKEEIRTYKPDLFFLGVELRGSKVYELLHEMQSELSWPIKVVFCSANEKFMLQAIRSSAFDFLLKPFQQGELEALIRRFCLVMSKDAGLVNVVTDSPKTFPCDKIFLVNTPVGSKALRANDIYYFEFNKEFRSWLIYTSDDGFLKLKRETTAEHLMEVFPSFLRINQQQIINPEKLDRLEGRNCIMKTPHEQNTKLILSRNCLIYLKESFATI